MPPITTMPFPEPAGLVAASPDPFPSSTALLPTVASWRPLEAMERLVELTIATCASPETRRAYRSQLMTFLQSGHPLNREGVALYIQGRRDAGATSATILSATTAIRKLANEALVRKLMSRDEYEEIHSIKPGKHYATRAGLWLTVPQAEALLALPDRSKYLGKRDACLLATMLGCGLRRSEMANLKWDRYQKREGRSCWVDINGKGGKRRTIPIPSWAQPDIDAWKYTAENETPQTDAYGDHWNGHHDLSYVAGGLKHDTVQWIINGYGEKIGLKLNPHDLRRTLSQMMRRAGADLEQIQYTLGHESIETTVRYLGSVIELAPGMAAVDRIQLQCAASNAPVSEDAVNQLQMGMLLEHMENHLRERETPEGCD
jgi:integrase/recombinase XerD